MKMVMMSENDDIKDSEDKMEINRAPTIVWTMMIGSKMEKEIN